MGARVGTTEGAAVGAYQLLGYKKACTMDEVPVSKLTLVSDRSEPAVIEAPASTTMSLEDMRFPTVTDPASRSL